jgi:DNA repair protein RadA/Sms
MAKKSLFVCQQCGYESLGWLGKCPNCASWGSLVETVQENTSTSRGRGKSRGETKKPQKLAEIKPAQTIRTSTKITEFDRVLGGGVVPGQVILIAGEPGIGKSTILLQFADNLGNVLYASGEESVYQLKIRADRLGVNNKNIQILETVDVDNIIDEAGESEYSAVIVDSIQTMQTRDLSGMSGSAGQVRECATRLVRFAKSRNVPVLIVGHVTKEGTVAGPALLAHLVDTVLWFEGDRDHLLRVLRSVKNRFGPTDEVGLFTMEDKGLVSANDPEKLFLTQTAKPQVGSVTTVVMQGARPILVEIQALVVSSRMAFPKRIAQGIDSKKFELLLAVLTRRNNLPLYEYDSYVNVSGGITVREPAIDLAVCLAIASSYFNKPVNNNIVAIGEVGLLGNIREVPAINTRIKEARRLGYKEVISAKTDPSLYQIIKKIFK